MYSIDICTLRFQLSLSPRLSATLISHGPFPNTAAPPTAKNRNETLNPSLESHAITVARWPLGVGFPTTKPRVKPTIW